MNNSTKIKIMELKLLGHFASSYCYNNPSKINVDITGKCNLNCVWCSRHFAKIPNIHMNKQLAINLFNWMNDPFTVTFAGFGEPLMYPIDDLIDLINMSRQKAKQVQIITNGTLLKGNIVEKLGISKLSRLIVSVDSSDKGIYKKIRGTDLDKIKKNISYFTHNFSIPVYVNAVAFKGDDSNWKEFIEETGVADVRLKPLKESDSSRDAGFKPNDKYMEIKRGHCFQPFYEFNLGVDGCYHPCCTCRTMGTKIKNFDDAWNGEWIRNFRDKLIKKIPPKYCKDWCKM